MSHARRTLSYRNDSPLRGALVTAFLLFALAIEAPAQTADSGRAAAARIAAERWGVPEAEVAVVGEASLDGITRFKVLHAKSDRLDGVDLDADLREASARVVAEKLAARRNRDFIGKLDRELARKVQDEGPAGTTGVVVWAKSPGEPPRLDRGARRPSAAAVEALKTFHRSATRNVLALARQRGWRVKYQAAYAPVIVLEVPNDALRLLEEREDVDAIYLERTYQDEADVSVPAIDAGTVWNRGFNGSGISVAVVETGGIYFGHANLADGQYCKPGNPTPVGAHASGVAGIIASTHATYRGVAFGAPALLSGNAGDVLVDSNVIECTEWAIDQGATVVNYSFGTDSDVSMVGLDRYVDYVVRHWFVTMVKSAGNIGFTCFEPESNVTSPGKGWNILTVGNYNDKETADNANDEMSATSCFGDPASDHDDREKPEVAAPGTNITTTYCTGPSDCTGSQSGTSFAAPHVTGCTALLMDRDAALTIWPESIKAVLMASAVVNLEGSTRLSEKDGAGGIECDSADDVVRGVSGNESHGTYSKADFPKLFTFTATAGQTVRVAIAWDSLTDAIMGTTSPTTDVLKADLDLRVTGPAPFGQAILASSHSYDNSYEIVEFTAPATGVYTARVHAYRFDGNFEYLGFAWWAGTREKN
jgi:hypothetical protein